MPTALVLGAGGMFGAWEVGVWSVLREHVHVDMIVGASAGAWIGWLIACGATPDELAREWQDPATAKLMQRGFHRWGWLLPDALYEKARQLHTLGPPKIPFGLTLVEAPRMRVRLFRDGEITWQHLAATASIPLSFPPVESAASGMWTEGLRDRFRFGRRRRWARTRAIAINCLTLLPFRLVRAIVRPPRPSANLAVTLIEPSRPLGSLKDGVIWKADNVSAGSSRARRTRNVCSVRLECNFYAALSDLSNEGFATAAVSVGATCFGLRISQTERLRAARRRGGAPRVRCLAHLRDSGDTLAVGDLLETEDGQLRICKYVGFEPAQWIIVEPRHQAEPESAGQPTAN